MMTEGAVGVILRPSLYSYAIMAQVIAICGDKDPLFYPTKPVQWAFAKLVGLEVRPSPAWAVQPCMRIAAVTALCNRLR